MHSGAEGFFFRKKHEQMLKEYIQHFEIIDSKFLKVYLDIMNEVVQNFT